MSNPLRQRSANCGLVIGTVCHGAETLHPLAQNLGAVEFGSQAVLFRPALDVSFVSVTFFTSKPAQALIGLRQD
jgi:hypothetical protein